MRISDWSSDVCSSDLSNLFYHVGIVMQLGLSSHLLDVGFDDQWCARHLAYRVAKSLAYANATGLGFEGPEVELLAAILTPYWRWNGWRLGDESKPVDSRTEEHTSELQSLMSISYAVFAMKIKNKRLTLTITQIQHQYTQYNTRHHID